MGQLDGVADSAFHPNHIKRRQRRAYRVYESGRHALSAALRENVAIADLGAQSAERRGDGEADAGAADEHVVFVCQP